MYLQTPNILRITDGEQQKAKISNLNEILDENTLVNEFG